jgi:transcriptional regulator with XRE-family HTH domain
METSGVTLQEQIAEETRAMLARRRLTGRQLATKLGWSPQALSRRLTGQLPFTVADLEAVAQVLDIPVTRLLPRSEDGFRYQGIRWALAA